MINKALNFSRKTDQVQGGEGCTYPYQQLVGLLRQPVPASIVTLQSPTAKRWKWEIAFMTDLLRWL